MIFHGAATVRFDEGLRQSTNINVRGTMEIMKLAKQMPNLKVCESHIGFYLSILKNESGN